MNRKITQYATIMAAFVALQGCVYVRDVPGDWPQDERHPTVGEQLDDLRDAYDDGLLTREEYEQVRARIIAGSD